jgi:hypothetical protein
MIRRPASTNETALSWKQTGPQGPQGPVGAPGPQGPQGVPGTSASSHAYEASNTHELPEDTYLVGLTLPSGKYVVWSTVDFYNDNDGNANTQCGIWTGSDTNPDQHFHFSPGDDTAIFSGDQYFATLMTTVTLTASENQILVFCAPGGGKGYATKIAAPQNRRYNTARGSAKSLKNKEACTEINRKASA